MTNENTPQESAEEQSSTTATLEEKVDILIGMTRDIADKMETLTELVDEMNDTISYDHGTPGYDSAENLLEDPEEE